MCLNGLGDGLGIRKLWVLTHLYTKIHSLFVYYLFVIYGLNCFLFWFFKNEPMKSFYFICTMLSKPL